MSRMIAAGFFTALLVMSAAMGCYSSITAPKVDGFTGLALAPPGGFTPEPLQSLPDIAGEIQSRPDVSIMIYIGQIYADCGGSVRLNITNNDSRAMFLEEAAFSWAGSTDMFSVDVNAEIAPRESLVIPALAFGGPSAAGTRGYQLGIRMLQMRNGNWSRVLGQSDDWLMFSENNLEVLGLPDGDLNKISLNPRMYYTRVNDIVDFGIGPVVNATDNATAGMGDGFTVGKACAIFDWLDTNLNYTEDPGSGDVWFSPDQTLSAGGGDCEDYALLMAAMADHAGGYSRIYLTADHAFAAVYVGNTTDDLDSAIADVRAYYRTELNVYSFSDEKGYWVIADPLGSFHLGGSAVGLAPTQEWNGTWNFTFQESDTLFAVDVTGTDISRGLWLDVNIWMGMMLVFGFLAFGLILSAHSAKPATKVLCHICACEIKEDLYQCPHCWTTYHRACAFSKAYCMTCQKPIQYPPPPKV